MQIVETTALEFAQGAIASNRVALNEAGWFLAHRRQHLQYPRDIAEKMRAIADDLTAQADRLERRNDWIERIDA